MAVVPVEFHGVHLLDPEEFLCAVFRLPSNGKIIPVWLPPVEGGRVAAHTAGYSPNRPDTHELVTALIENDGQLETATISTCHEGVFAVDLETGNGNVYDVKISDAIIIADNFDVDLTIDEELATQVALYVSEDDLEEYFGLTFTTPDASNSEAGEPHQEESLSASGDAQADADFEEMMRSLGVSESDFEQGENGFSNNDTDVTNDAKGEDEV